MGIKIKEILVVICLAAFIIWLNLQTTYADVPVGTIMQAIGEAADLEGMEKYSSAEIKEQFEINVNECEGVAYYGHTSIMESETILVVCLRDKSQGAAIIDTITEQRDELIKLFQSYAPEQYELLRSSVLIQKDKYILYVVSDDVKAVESAFMNCITE